MRETDELANIVLPRELTALADAVRVVAAPPTPAVDEPFALRPADADRDARLGVRMDESSAPGQGMGSTTGRCRGGVDTFGSARRAVLSAVHPESSAAPTWLYRAVPGGKGFHRDVVWRRSTRYRSACGDRGTGVRQPGCGIGSCCRDSSPGSSASSPVADASCSTRTTVMPARAGSVNSPAAFSSASTTWRTGEWRSTCFTARRPGDQ